MLRSSTLAATVRCSVLLCLASTAGAVAPPVSLTPLPAAAPGAPTYKFINNAGIVAGDRSTYRAVCWSPSWGLAEMHASGPGVPALAATWAEAINASGTMLISGCIPPPGGNGPCGTYLYTARAGAPNTPLDFTAISPDFAHPGYAYGVLLSDSGSIAGQYNTLDSSITRVFVHSVLSGWHDLTGLFAPGSYVTVADINASDHVLLQRGGQIYIWSEAEGLVPILPPGGGSATAIDMNDSGAIIGTYTGPGAQTLPFRYTPGSGWLTLGTLSAFPGARPERINNAGMVVGTYQSGVFLYTDDAGMAPLPGVPHTVVGFNARGDILATDHDPVTYQTLPFIKLFGKPVQPVQTLIDPAQSQIIVDQITDINDSGQFVVGGRVSTTQWTRTAFLVTQHCPADFDASGTVAVQDIFEFLSAWFAADPRADADRNGTLAVQDIFEFLNTWMAGC